MPVGIGCAPLRPEKNDDTLPASENHITILSRYFSCLSRGCLNMSISLKHHAWICPEMIFNISICWFVFCITPSFLTLTCFFTHRPRQLIAAEFQTPAWLLACWGGKRNCTHAVFALNHTLLHFSSRHTAVKHRHQTHTSPDIKYR